MVNSKGYNRGYYNTHRSSLSRYRKKQYKTDRQFRDQRKLSSIEYYNKYKRVTTPVDRRIVPDGDVNYFSIGKLAEALGKSIFTIRSYYKPILRNGRLIRHPIMPDNLYTDSRNWKLINERQLRLCVRVFKQFERKEIKNLTELGKILKENWKL